MNDWILTVALIVAGVVLLFVALRGIAQRSRVLGFFLVAAVITSLVAFLV